MQKVEGARGRSLGVFGKNLAAALVELNIKPADLCHTVGLSKAALLRVLRGQRDMQLSTIMRILAVVPVKFDALVFGADKEVQDMLDEGQVKVKAGYVKKFSERDIRRAWLHTWEQTYGMGDEETALGSKTFTRLLSGLGAKRSPKGRRGVNQRGRLE